MCESQGQVTFNIKTCRKFGLGMAGLNSKLLSLHKIDAVEFKIQIDSADHGIISV